MSFSNDQQQTGDESQSDTDLAAALNEPSDGNFVLEESRPKRQMSAGTLAVGGLIAACAAVVYFMYLRNGPQAASASDATAAASSTITQFLSSDGENVEKMKQMLKDTEKAVQQFKNHPAQSQIPLDDLKTNPFRQVTTDVSNKAGEKAAEEAAKKRREETLKAVQGLRVQSIIAGGARKAAMINNKMYAEGEEVDRFVVEKIKPGSIIVRFEKSRFELKMQK